MRAFGLNIIAFAVVSMATAGRAAPLPTAPEAELMNAFHTADSVELYVVQRGLETPAGIHADSLRRLGCRYLLHRSMRQWAELERAMIAASVRIDETAAYGEIRVGLVFGDRTGTLLEVYAGDLPMPDGRVKGYIQRREVAISGTFAEALHSFADAHRDLAEVDRAMPEQCGRPRPPETPLIPPPFHFSDPSLDRSHESLNDQVRAATMALLRSNDAAHTAVREAGDSPPDSPAWLRARSAAQQAVADVRSARRSLQVYGRFLDSAIGRVPEEEARLAVANRQMISDQLRAESDSLVTLLALLAGLQIGWPP